MKVSTYLILLKKILLVHLICKAFNYDDFSIPQWSINVVDSSQVLVIKLRKTLKKILILNDEDGFSMHIN